MNSQSFEAYLIATPHGDDRVEIAAYTSEMASAGYTTVISVGESFGGRDFKEWHAAGLAKGIIPAEWLRV